MTVLDTPSAARRLADLPMPAALPLVGHLHRMSPSRLHQVLEGWCRQLGPMYRLRLGRHTALVVSRHELLHQVLRERPHRYRRASVIESVVDEMGANGVFSVEGERWLPQRKLVMQALAPSQINGFYPTLHRITGRLHRRWQRAAAEGRGLEMRDELTRYTVDVTTALAFGEDPNTLERSDDLIQRHLALVFPMLMSRINMPFPLWRYVKTPADRRFDAALAAVHAHIGGLIGRARDRMAAQPGRPPANALESLLVARDQPGSGLSDADVSANVLTLLLAGEDTTAHTLAWTLSFLAADPALQETLHAQAVSVLGDEAVCARPDDLRRLDAFEAAATEALRLKPIAPMFFLENLVDVELDGVAVPARTPLFFLLRPDMTDPACFADPQAYRPGRWLPAGALAPAACPRADAPVAHPPAAHEARAHMQFGAGPRVCPGRHLATVEMKLVLSMLMRHFHVDMAPGAPPVREVMAFSMMPSAVQVRLRSRGG